MDILFRHKCLFVIGEKEKTQDRIFCGNLSKKYEILYGVVS